MPQIEQGAERQWHDERRTDKWAKEREAFDKIKEVLEKYNGDPWQIPTEKTIEFRQAAELIVATAESDPNFKPKENILNLAKDMLKILPEGKAIENPEID